MRNPNRKFSNFMDQVVNIITSPIRLLKAFIFAVGLFFITLGAIVIFVVYHFFSTLPNFKTMTFDDLKVIAQERVITKLENKKIVHHWIELKDVSRDLLYSIVMSEDATFFEHNGINYDAMASSFIEDIRERKNAYGASTISQQVSKNLFLDNEKSYTRKLKEIFITLDMEKSLRKNQILELYLNIAEFGPDIFGIQAASNFYFHKTPEEINAAEAAFMALMLPSPKRNYYAIYENKNLSYKRKRRIHRILNDMLFQEYISEKQYQKYIKYNFFKKNNKKENDLKPFKKYKKKKFKKTTSFYMEKMNEQARTA